MDKKIAYLIANFGGPRSTCEIESFLKELLTDGDVIRTRLPKWLQNFFFKNLAKKRAKLIVKDYELIGGKSPIYEETEVIAKKLQEKLKGPILTFHRYLPNTHADFKNKLNYLDFDELRIFPMFPQFTYATTGSIARWFLKNFPKQTLLKLRWVKSYPTHPGFVQAQQLAIQNTIEKYHLKKEESILLFSAHGVPKSFVATGDIYLDECQASFERIKQAFPKCLSRLSFQSQFGKEEWVRPYTSDICKKVLSWNRGRKNVLFVPISFTTDHIETLYEIAHIYMPVIAENGLHPYRVPALTFDPIWIKTILELLDQENYCTTQMLIR